MNHHEDYKRIVEAFIKNKHPKDVDTTEVTDNEYFAISELIDAGMLKGEIITTPVEGTVKKKITGVIVTLKGRLFHDELLETLQSKTILGMLKSNLKWIVPAFFGAALSKWL
jgi:hypothetical protein